MHLEIYALNRNVHLRRLYVESEVRFGHLQVRMYPMQEFTQQQAVFHTLWVGLIYDEDGLQSPGGIELSAFHGAPLSSVERFATDGSDMPLLSGNRVRGCDKIKWNEVYGARLGTATMYTKPQSLVNEKQIEAIYPRRQGIQPMNVIAVMACTCESMRKPRNNPSKQQKGEVEMVNIVVMKQAYPAVILLREDDNSVIIEHRCTSDFDDNMHAQEQSRAMEKARKDPQYREHPWSRPSKRITDKELADNALAMSMIDDPEKFKSFDGKAIKPGRRRIDDEEPFKEVVIDDEDDDWPDPHRKDSDGNLVIRGTFNYLKYHSEDRVGLATRISSDEVRARDRSLYNNKIQPELAKELRALRLGAEQDEKNPLTRFSNYGFPELANAVRRGSCVMHMQLAVSMRQIYAERVNNLNAKIAEQPSADEDVRSLLRRQLIEERDREKVRFFQYEQIVLDNRRFNPQDYRDPVYERSLELVSESAAKKVLSNRIRSALHNVRSMHSRGIALFEKRAVEYRSNVTESIEPIEWSDGEEGWNVEDDIPLERSTVRLTPSRTWTKKHMHQIATKWNTELATAEQSASTAIAEGGYFSALEGRYQVHAIQKVEKLKTQQAARTTERRLCTWHFSKKGCQFSFHCTRRHDRNEQEKSDGKFARWARQHETPQPVQDPSYVVLERTQTRTTVEETQERILVKNLSSDHASSFVGATSKATSKASSSSARYRARSESPQTDRRRARGGQRTGDDNVWERLRARNSAVPPIGQAPRRITAVPMSKAASVPIGGRAQTPKAPASEKKAPSPKQSIGRKRKRYD